MVHVIVFEPTLYIVTRTMSEIFGSLKLLTKALRSALDRTECRTVVSSFISFKIETEEVEASIVADASFLSMSDTDSYARCLKFSISIIDQSVIDRISNSRT